MARILQIEDNEDIQNILLTCFLKNMKLSKPTLVPKGSFCFQTQEIDLVLLDIMLPGKGGEEVLKFIRQEALFLSLC